MKSNSQKIPLTAPKSKGQEDLLQRDRTFFMVNSDKANNIIMLHHNIQCLNNKIQESSLYLHVSNFMADVLCFTDH
jgi:hypothetical protein